MATNNKPSPNVKYFAGYVSKRNKLNNLECPNCPAMLNIKYTCTKEYEEAPDGAKARKVQCKRCKTIGWICETCGTNFVCNTMKSLKLHNGRNHKKGNVNMCAKAEENLIRNDENVESVTTDEYFLDLHEEENWISFNNNLIHLKKMTEHSLQQCTKVKQTNA